MDSIQITVSKSDVQGLPLGAVVRVVLSGKVTEIREGYGEDEKNVARVCIEGSAELQPTRISDVARVAIAGLSDAKRPMNVPYYSRQELHAP